MKLISYEDDYGTKNDSTFQNLPSFCNHCNNGVDFIIKKCVYSYSDRTFNFLFECPACHKFSLYICDDDHNQISQYPSKTITLTPPINIQNLSPEFCEIYKQSQLAENSSLFEICGMGYRKALEFLVKDYLISLNPDDKVAICDEPLMQSIQRIEYKQIQILAERVAWLGNDETHYVRKHTDLDLQDLKRFLDKIIKYIDMELTTLEADRIHKKKSPPLVESISHISLPSRVNNFVTSLYKLFGDPSPTVNLTSMTCITLAVIFTPSLTRL